MAAVQTLAYLKRRLMPQLSPVLPGHAGAVDQLYLMPVWRALAQDGAHHICCAPALTRKRRHIALIGDLNLPQCRKYRVEQLAEFWRIRGIDLTYAHYGDIPRASRILQLATHVIEYRLPATPVTEMLRYEARRLRLPILYDIDDPLFSVAAYETYGNMQTMDQRRREDFLRTAPGYLEMMNGADAICVSTPGLAQEAARLTRRPVLLRRNFADASTLDHGQRAIENRGDKDGMFRIAFSSGSDGHESDLGLITDTLERLISAAPVSIGIEV